MNTKQLDYQEGEEADDDDDFLNDHRLATICSGTNSLGTSERGKSNVGQDVYEKIKINFIILV